MSPGTRAGIHRSCGTTTSISPHPKSSPGRTESCCLGQCEKREPVNNHSSASFRNDHSDVMGYRPLIASRSLHNVGVGYRCRIGDRTGRTNDYG